MVKITFLDLNVVPGSTIYDDPGTHLTQQNQDNSNSAKLLGFRVGGAIFWFDQWRTRGLFSKPLKKQHNFCTSIY